MTLAAPASTLFVPLPSAAAPSVNVEPVTPISGSDEFLAACQRSVDCLVVVQVKAPWCRSCKALEAKVRRLAREYADEVVFFSMNYEDPENKPIAYRLGVKNMPTFMFFQGEFGQVEQFTCGPNRAAIIREKIDIYVAGECPYEPTDNVG
jgi:thiol-disulfide isomerase/thioredoxin